MTHLTFRWEKCRKLFDEPNLQELLIEHWNELGVHKDEMPLDPDFARFIALEDAGIFRVWAARDDKTLVGYIGWFVQGHLHYRSTLTAVEDLYLLSAPYRRGMAGQRMFTTALDALRELGVKRVMLHSKVHFERERGGIDKFLVRLGFENTDLLWSRML